MVMSYKDIGIFLEEVFNYDWEEIKPQRLK